MIIVVCTDDPGLEGITMLSANKHPGVFGDVYKVYDRRIPPLKEKENLFILAHGAFRGDEGKPIIGDQSEDFYISAGALAVSTRHLYPNGWTGNVYVDACYSAMEDEELLSFARLLAYPLAEINASVRVSGRQGLSSGLIALPGDSGWITFP